MHIRSLRTLSFCLATAAMTIPASAADMAARPRKAPPAAPAVAAVYDWSGFYVGANAGAGSNRNCWDFVTVAGLPFPENEGCHNSTGGVAGGQFGYRWQAGAFVFGAEAQGNWADLSGSAASSTFLIVPGDLTVNSRLRAFGLFTGQVGYAWNNVLLYAKGGAAIVDNRYSHAQNNNLINSATDTRWGGTLGVGVEYGFAPGWSFGVEYNHLFMGRDTLAFAESPVGFPSTNSIGQDVDIVTARINYRFGGPPVIRY